MSARKPVTLDLLQSVQAELGLPSLDLVEKDFHVVQALVALSKFTPGHKDYVPGAPHLVFGGGTALCRAHRLIERMSEDIDLKIVCDKPLSKSQLKAFREQVTAELQAAGFSFDPENPEQLKAFNGDRAFTYHLPYDPVAARSGALRPGIQIELSYWPLYEASVDCQIGSFVSQAQELPPEVASFPCAATVETAAEKFVALTRRTGEERALGDDRDATLVRHIYDLHRIQGSHQLDHAGRLIRKIMESDRVSRGKKFPAYREDPRRETRRALEALKEDPDYRVRFDAFQLQMVYGAPANFDECLDTLAKYAGTLDEN